MLHRDLVRAAVAAVALTTLAASPAHADVERRYHGTTPQGYEIVMTGGTRGDPDLIRTAYRVGCRRHAYTYEGVLDGVSPPEFAESRREFALVDEESGSGPRGRTAAVEVAMTGRRITRPGRPGTEYWQGTLEVELDLLDAETDRLRERCRTRRMRWRAWREGFGTGRWTMTSDPGEYVGEGAAHSLGLVSAFGDDRAITVWGGDDPNDSGFRWTAEFSAPAGQRLTRGATHAVDPDQNDPFGDSPEQHAHLYVSSGGDSCSYGSGEFTVDAARYDRRGRLRALRLRFTYWCGTPGGPALRGTIAYRSRP